MGENFPWRDDAPPAGYLDENGKPPAPGFTWGCLGWLAALAVSGLFWLGIIVAMLWAFGQL